MERERAEHVWSYLGSSVHDALLGDEDWAEHYGGFSVEEQRECAMALGKVLALVEAHLARAEHPAYRIDLFNEHGHFIHASQEGDRDSRLALVDGLLMNFDEATYWELMNMESNRVDMAGVRCLEVAHA